MSSATGSSPERDDHDRHFDGVQLINRYGQRFSQPELPDTYAKFGVDSPRLIAHLQADLVQMSELRSGACFRSVIENMEGHIGSPVSFERVGNESLYESPPDQQTTALTSFLVGFDVDSRMLPADGEGVSLESQLIVDAAVIGTVESGVGTTREELVWTNPDLLKYDYLVLCQVLDGVIYSSVTEGQVTPDLLSRHLAGELSTRSQLLTNDSSFYEDIYDPILDSLLNEHFHADH